MLRFIVRMFVGRPAPRPRYRPRGTAYPSPPPPAPSAPYTPPPAPRRAPEPEPSLILQGRCYVIDGDTIVVNKTRIRIAGIDAPELDHPWGKKAKFALIAMCKGQEIRAELSSELSYDRTVAKCYLPDGTDIAAALVEMGLALDWPKFSGGVYRHLEPPGVRKRLWRAAARQAGRMVD